MTPKMCIIFIPCSILSSPAPSPWARKCLGWSLQRYSERASLGLACSRFCTRQLRISSPTPAPSWQEGNEISAGEEGFLCFCKSLKWPIFSFAAPLSPHQFFFFSCSEIHSPSLEMWALYRKSLACTSTNGWSFLSAVHGVAKALPKTID